MKKTATFLPPSRIIAALTALGLSACSTAPTALDQRFGLSVKEAQKLQTLNHHPCPPQDMAHGRAHNMAHGPTHGMPHDPAHCATHGHPGAHLPPLGDGVTAKAAVDLYQKTFESPPPAAPVFNIGIGTPSNR